MKNVLWGVLILLIGLAIGAGIAAFVLLKKTADQSSSSIKELRETGYQLVSPLLVANPSSEFEPMEDALKQGLFSYLNDSSVKSISVYFQDLNSGQWALLDGSDTYNPASLLKVPYMMAYLKEAETNPAILSEEFPYETEPADGTSTEFDTLIPGREYTVEELIQAMIADSDNGAKYTLLQHIDPNLILDIFNNLNVPAPNVPNYTISVQPYARFFKVLYNATYLNADMSEKAMEFLSQATFNEGITAGVPPDVLVANKFGQYTGPGTSGPGSAPGTWELSDCGLVYYPNDPYLLCVMTRGKPLDFLSGVIQATSKIVYDEVDSYQQ